MPKKKIQHKGKSKHASDEDNDFVLKKNDIENPDDEYKTVVDSEANKKYSKRLIQNNWLKYEEDLNVDCEDEKNVLPKTDDFSHLIKTASSDCSHFQFNTEKLWKKEENFVTPSNIFNLDLNILSSGLACVPFYERIGLDEICLSIEDKQRLDAAAEKSLKDYNLIREKLFKKVDDQPNVKHCEDSKTLNETLKSLSFESENKSTEGLGKLESVKTDISVKKVEGTENSGEKKSKIFFSENDEDLEDWLDSVLDD